MGNNPEEETSYTTQHQDAFLKYVGNEYCTKPRHLPVITPQSIINNNLFPSAIASRSSQSSHDPYDVPSHDEEYIMPNDMVKTTPEWSDGAACSVIAARLNSNLPTESPHNWGQSNVNLNDYHSHPIEISSIFGYQISPTGGIREWKCTHSMVISPMWHATYSLSYHTTSQWRLVRLVGEVLSAGGS